jgi:hypothetical protein
MMIIGIDQLLAYLATGEDEELMLGVLPRQADAARLLAEARVALELLSPAGPGPAVQARLEALEEAIGEDRREVSGERMPPPIPAPESPAPPDASPSNLESRQSFDPASTAFRSARFMDEPSFAYARRALPLRGLSEAIRAGARQARRIGSAELRDGMVIARPHKRASPRMMAREPELDVLELRIVAASARPRLPAARFEAGAAGTVELAREDVEGGPRLRVQLLDRLAGAGTVLVTLVPEEGPVVQATTDATATVLLPWPDRGHGVLRLDGRETLEIRLIVDGL